MVQKIERVLSSHFTIVEIEHTSKEFSVLDWIIGSNCHLRRTKQMVTKALVISFCVIGSKPSRIIESIIIYTCMFHRVTNIKLTPLGNIYRCTHRGYRKG